MKKSKVSVIIPVYNSEKYILNLLEQLKEQTYKNFEVIIINDGSVDDSEIICKNMIKGFNNFKLYNQKNSGVSIARNNGLEKATGEYVVFIDSDDSICNNTIELLVYNIENYSVDYAFGAYITSKNSKLDNVVDAISTNVNDLKLSIINSRILEDTKIYGNSRTIWGKIYKLKIIKDNNIKFIEDLKLFEDGLFNLEYLNYVFKYKSFSEKIYKYRIDINSSVKSYKEDLYEQDQIRLENLKKYIKIDDRYKIAYNLVCFEFFCGYIINYSLKKTFFYKEIKNKSINSIYSDSLKCVEKKYLGNNHKIINNLIKNKMYFLINILCLSHREICRK
ncbi:MAG: glycosyltransferase [bacterium]